MITVDLNADGTLHCLTNDGRDEPAVDLLARFGRRVIERDAGKHRVSETSKPRRVWGVLGLLLTGVLLGGCGSIAPADVPVAAPPATAPEPPRPVEEQLYLDVLDAEGIHYSTPDDALDAGYMGCEFLDAGGSVFEAIQVAIDVGYTPFEAGYIVGAFTGTLCPQHSGAGA